VLTEKADFSSKLNISSSIHDQCCWELPSMTVDITYLMQNFFCEKQFVMKSQLACMSHF